FTEKIMKKILIPTDFSPIADNASAYAIHLASKLRSILYFYHVYHIHKVEHNKDFPAHKQPVLLEKQRQMNLQEMKFMELIREYDLSLQTFVEPDSIAALFDRIVEKHQIDLVVMGSKGASGLTKVIFGSTAARAIEWSSIPVLIVPANFEFQPIKHIVLAIDKSTVSPSWLLSMKKIAHAFESKITILHVNASTKEVYDLDHTLSFNSLEVEDRVIPLKNNINETINLFIQEENCDLLCMIRREKNLFQDFLQTSVTKNQAYNSQIPILVLPEQSAKVTKTRGGM
ncbi:MAG: universal stress protein, partial [Bacteroidota bacterium]